jgi:hypothetical protein
MPKKFIDRVETTRTLNTIHLALTLMAFWIGGILYLPGETFLTAPGYRVLADIASENSWAAFFCLVGFVGVAGHFYDEIVMKIGSALVLATAHGLLAVCTFLGNPISLGTGAYLFIAYLGYYLSWRRGRGL